MLIICLLLAFLELIQAQSYVATSTHEMGRLLEAENDLLRDFKYYVTELEKQLNTVRVLLADAAKRKEEAQANPVEYIANPLNSFSLLRRMHTDAPKLVAYLDIEPVEEGKQHISEYNLNVVTPQDYDTAAEGLLRIQDVYDLDERDMALGRLRDKQFNSTLNALDCLALGRYQLKKGNKDKAITWLQIALEQYKTIPECVYELREVDRKGIRLELGQILLNNALPLNK